MLPSNLKIVLVGLKESLMRVARNNGIIGIPRTDNVDELVALYNGTSIVMNLSYEETFDGNDLRHEIIDSKQEISRLLGKDVTALCFPQGRFSDKVLECSKEAGYSKLYSSIAGGYFDRKEKDGLICRNLVQAVTDREFEYILNSTSKFFVKRTVKLHYQK